MPNQMSADSRRVNFIWDHESYATLEARAKRDRMSAGELIRRTLEEKLGLNPKTPVIQIRVQNPAVKPDTDPARGGKSSGLKKKGFGAAEAKRKKKKNPVGPSTEPSAKSETNIPPPKHLSGDF